MTWKLIPLKKITTKIGSGATPRGGNSAYRTEGITLIRSLNVHDFEFRYEGLAFINEEQASETRLARVIVKSQDILLNITGASVARCCIVPEHLLPARVNQHVSLVRVDPNRADSRYVLYCINSPIYKHQLLTLAQGGATREALTQQIIGNLEIPLPPIPIQRKIANFLERKTQQINELICIKERRIELLQEQRTALINQAVTKGLDPNVEMKPSGVEWIGKIPKHWTVTRLKYLGESIIGLSYKPENVTDEENGILVLRASNIQNGKPSFLDNVYVNAEIDEKLRLKEGDILICSRSGSRDLIGKNMTITKELAGITFGVFMTVFRTKFVRFISYFLNSQIFKNQSGLFLTSTINQLTINTLNNFLICFPTDEGEQAQIANFLERKTGQIDELLSTEQRKIELLKEYRQSLISEAVTGKIDVRNEV